MDRHAAVDLLDRLTRIPTISRRVTPEMAEQVRVIWEEQGLVLHPLTATEGKGAPALFGTIEGPAGAPTLLVYGHYDVQPPGDLSQWRWGGRPCDPFVPSYFVGEEHVVPAAVPVGELDSVTLVARGGADNKGQHSAALLGLLAAARAGTLAWNLKVLLDGEEEHGSPNLGAIVREHRDLLAADLCVGSDGPKQQNHPTIIGGVRGLLRVDLRADNGAPASLHSGNYGNIIDNPFLPLARAVAAVDAGVREHAERNDSFRREAESRFAEWAGQGRWKPYLMPTVNLNHIMSEGASPELSRTIIPRSIHGRLDVRLTPDTPPGEVRRIIDAAVERVAADTPGVTLRVETGPDLPASYTSPAHPAFDWLLGLLGGLGDGPPVALPLLGGTLPAFVFTDILETPTFWIPAANSDNQQHDINEHYVLRHFFMQQTLYERIASSLPA